MHVSTAGNFSIQFSYMYMYNVSQQGKRVIVDNQYLRKWMENLHISSAITTDVTNKINL